MFTILFVTIAGQLFGNIKLNNFYFVQFISIL